MLSIVSVRSCRTCVREHVTPATPSPRVLGVDV